MAGNTGDNSIKEGKVYYDIKFSAVVPDTDNKVHLIINVEAQKDEPIEYPLIKRAIYYVSRMISAQKNAVFVNREYGKIRKVYSIWIQMNVRDESEANSITKFSIGKKCVTGSSKEKEQDYDLMAVVMMRLGKPELSEDNRILRLLDTLLSAEKPPDEKKNILETDFNIPMTEEMDEEVNIMCNLGEGIREKTTIQSIAALMDSMKIDAEEAMRLLKVKPENQEVYKKQVEGLINQMAVV